MMTINIAKRPTAAETISFGFHAVTIAMVGIFTVAAFFGVAGQFA